MNQFEYVGRPTAGPTRVFISHASEDAGSALVLLTALESQGIKCWIAERDIAPGASYSRALIEGLTECEAFLLILTKAAADSPHVRREIERATSKDKRFLVVILDDVDPMADDELSYHLSVHHWLDARQGLPQVTPTVIQALSNILSAGPVPGPVPEPVSGTPYIGVDVGSTKIAVAAIHLDGSGIGRTTLAAEPSPLERPVTARSLVNQIGDMVKCAIPDLLNGQNPAGIGIALPGQVDPRGGSLKFSPGLGLRNTPIKAGLSGMFPGVPIRVDNDTRCATRCELRLGTGLDYNSIVCIFIGAGVGSGVAISNRIHFGAGYCAGEVGHMKVDKSGPPCNCGQVGCLETFVNAPAVVARAQAKVIEWGNRDRETLLAESAALTPREVARAADAGDAAALEVMNEVGSMLGVGIANVLNLLNPDAVVLGGGLMSGLYLHLVGPVSEAVERNALSQVRNTPILQSQFSDTGPSLGAALLFHPDEEWVI